MEVFCVVVKVKVGSGRSIVGVGVGVPAPVSEDGIVQKTANLGWGYKEVKRELEAQCGASLSEACIAAAGRVLRTIVVHIDYELPTEQKITSEHVYSLDLMGVEKAYDIIREEDTDIKFYCVGYSVVKY